MLTDISGSSTWSWDSHPDRFSWLFGLQDISNTSPDERELAAALTVAERTFQVLPVIVPRLERWAKDRCESHPRMRALSDYTVAAKTLTRVQMALCRRLTEELDRQDIPYALIKGSAMRVMGYEEIDHRCSMDVDVAVPKRYLGRVDRILRDQGVVPASLNADGRHFHKVDFRTRRAVEAQHYELACRTRRQVVRGLSPDVEQAIRNSLDRLKPWHITKKDELGCYVTFDVHHGVCLDIPVDDLVRGARRHTSHDYTVMVPPPHWVAFHTIFKLYWEGVHNYSKGLYQFADLVRMSRLLTGDEAMALVELFSKYNLEAAGYFTLRRVTRYFGAELGTELRTFLELAGIAPESSPIDVNDLGDMWDKIWGLR